MGQFDCSKQLLRTHPEYCAKVLGMTYSRGYEGCRSLYPATSRLQSVPPRFYDVIDRDGSVLDSDMMYRGRARSVVREVLLCCTALYLIYALGQEHLCGGWMEPPHVQ